VWIALGEDQQVARPQRDRRVADGVPPRLAIRDEVVLDDALRGRHDHRRDLVRCGRFRHPRRREHEVEVHRTGELNRAQHVREDVGRLRHDTPAGCAGTPALRADMPSRASDEWQFEPDEREW
jgi:hypothetical protein